MNDCPDKDCRDNVTRLGTFFKVFGGGIGIVVSIILGLSIYGLGAEKRQNEKIHDLDKGLEVRSVKQDTIILNQTLFKLEINKMREEHKQEMQKLHEQRESDKKDILDAIHKRNRAVDP